MGNIRSIGKMSAGSTPDTYAYNTVGRLVCATVRKTSALPHTMAYRYDVYANLDKHGQPPIVLPLTVGRPKNLEVK